MSLTAGTSVDFSLKVRGCEGFSIDLSAAVAFWRFVAERRLCWRCIDLPSTSRADWCINIAIVYIVVAEIGRTENFLSPKVADCEPLRTGTWDPRISTMKTVLVTKDVHRSRCCWST